MFRFLRMGWLALVIGGGTCVAMLALLADDPGGAAILAGIALVLALASFLLPDDGPRRPRGFEPHRRR